MSLYNETNGRAILPTPSIGGVGSHRRVRETATLAFKHPGEAILLVGETTGWLGQSIYLRDICGREEGAPPPVDLTEERRMAISCALLFSTAAATAVHDVSDGGLVVALAEMAMASGIGADRSAAPSDTPAHAYWFGEDQARYVVTVRASLVDAVLVRAKAANVPVWVIGKTGGDTLTLAGERPILVTILRKRFEEWLPANMAVNSKHPLGTGLWPCKPVRSSG